MQYRFILAQCPVLVKHWMHLLTAKPARLLRYMAPCRECCSPRAAFPGHSLQHFIEKCDFSTSVRKIFQKPLAFFRQACYCCIQQDRLLNTTFHPCFCVLSSLFYIAIFFIYLLIIYPACPARDEKSDDPPARVVAFSFAHSRPQGGRVQAAKALLYKMTCRNCFSLSRPKKFV